MPSKSPKQARFMAACAHGAGYSSCPPNKVSTEFNQADKGSKLLHTAMKHRADGGQIDPWLLAPATHLEMEGQLGSKLYQKFWAENPNRDFNNTPSRQEVIEYGVKHGIPLLKAGGGEIKQSKVQVHYRPGHGAVRCANCTMFRAPNKCTAVSGDIQPSAICNLFQRKVAHKAGGGEVDDDDAWLKAMKDHLEGKTPVFMPPTSGVVDWNPQGRTIPSTKHAEGGPVTYTVQKDDNPSMIAKKMGVPLKQLMALNGITDESAKHLKIGTVLRLRPDNPPPESGGPKVGKRGGVGFEYNKDLQESNPNIKDINPTSHFEGPAQALVKEDKWRAGLENPMPAPPQKLEIPVEVEPRPITTHPGISDQAWSQAMARPQESTFSKMMGSPFVRDLMGMAEMAPIAGGMGRFGPYVAETAEPVMANMPKAASRLMNSMGWMKPGGKWNMLFGNEGPSAAGITPEAYTGPVLSRGPGGMIDSPFSPGLPVMNIGDILQFYRKQGDQLGTEGARTYMGGSNARVGSPEWNAQYEAKAGLRPGSLVESNAGRGDVIPHNRLVEEQGNRMTIGDYAKQQGWNVMTEADLDRLAKANQAQKDIGMPPYSQTPSEALPEGWIDRREMWKQAGDIVKTQVMHETHPLFDDMQMKVFQALERGEKPPIKATGGLVDTSKSTDKNTTTIRKGANRPDIPNDESMVNTNPTILMQRGYSLAGGGQTGIPKLPTTKGLNPSSVMVQRAAGIGMAKKASGFLHSPSPGRADKIAAGVRNGSYVIPADVVSGHGQGNSIAGANALYAMFKMGPYGSPAPRIGAGARPPRAPGMMHMSYLTPHRANGGEAHVPCMLSGGEFVVDPEAVSAVGGGNPERGFRILDQFVLNSRKKQLKQIKGLKPPKKD